VLKDHISDNPEILQAVPKLRKTVLDFAEKGTVDRGMDIAINKVPTKATHEGEIFESLGYKYKIAANKTQEDLQRSNEMQFVDAYRYPKSKAIKLMNQAEKEIVHVAIDRRMKELEETGLSRGEIINSKAKNATLPLKNDPYFQLLKTNRNIREMLIQPDEAFTYEAVILYHNEMK
jgi:hypothetical protein